MLMAGVGGQRLLKTPVSFQCAKNRTKQKDPYRPLPPRGNHRTDPARHPVDKRSIIPCST